MNTNPYKADFNLKAGTIEVRDNVRDGALRFFCMVDEAAPIIDQMIAALRKAEFVMSSPLMAVSEIDAALKSNQLATADRSMDVLAAYYKYSLQFFAEVASAVTKSRAGDPAALKGCVEMIEVMLEKHKHHLP